MSATQRPLRLDDLDPIMAMLSAYDLELFGEPMVDAEDVLAEWQAPSVDLTADSLGYLDDSGRMLVAGTMFQRGRLEISTVPELRDGPDEERMLEHFERLAADRGMPEVHRYVAGADRGGLELLARRGWVEDYTSWVLQLAPDAEIRTRQLPAGYAIRPFRAEDAHAVHTVVRDAFSEWQSEPRSYPDWEASVLRRPGGDPTRFRVATLESGAGGERIVGACVVFDGEQEAWVAQLAVHRDHRNRGLAQELLAETYAASRRRGLAKGGLSTDSRTGALGLYQRLGMTVFADYRCWVKRFGRDPGSTAS